MYENKHQQVISHQQFMRRLRLHLWVALVLLIASLAIGMVGYKVLEQLSWTDGFFELSHAIGRDGAGQSTVDRSG